MANLQDIEFERQAFEKDANDARFFPAEICFARTKSPSGRDEYANSHLQSRWEGWSARAALSAQDGQQSDNARDAARYRWLRNPNTDVALVLDKQTGWVPPDDAVPGVGGYHTYEYRAGEELDAAIDAAMSTTPSEKEQG